MHLLKVENNIKEQEFATLNEKLQEIINKEEEAINNNDFDEAQVIENKVSEIRELIQENKASIEDIQKQMIDLREQEIQLIKKKAKILEESFNVFNKIKKSGEYELETFKNTEISRNKNDSIKIKKLKEKLDFLNSNLESDKLYIDEEEAKITKVIKSQSSGVFEELDELKIQKEEILKEIDNLKKLLEAKCNELDLVEKSIESKEIEIDAIKSNFNHEFNKIHFKKKYYEDNLKDYTEQFTQYEKMLTNYTIEETKFEEKLRLLKSELNSLEDEIKKIKSDVDILNDDFNKKEYLLNSETEIRSKILLNEMVILNATNTIKKNSESINTLEVNIKKLESEIAVINMKMPALEEEKKSFVSAKNFKEAGRVSNELKAFLENKTKNLSKIEENKKKINEFWLENEKEQENLEKIKEEKIMVEKEYNIIRYEYLVTYRENLGKINSEVNEKSGKKGFHTSIIEKEVNLLINF